MSAGFQAAAATPADYEREHAGQVVEQVVRPTGLVDPKGGVRDDRREEPQAPKRLSFKAWPMR